MNEQAHKPYKNNAKRQADRIQQLGLAGGRFRLIKALGLAALLIGLAALFFYLGAPWYIGVGLIFSALSGVVFWLIYLKRVAAVDLDARRQTTDEVAALAPNEQVVATIPSVMRYGAIRSVSVIGRGDVIVPENALLLTNKAIWALTVPLPGTDQVVAEVDIGKWQWLSAYQDIIETLQDMTKSLPLTELIRQCQGKRLMGWEEIKSIKALPTRQALSLTRMDGHTFFYSIRLQEDYQRAKELLHIT